MREYHRLLAALDRHHRDEGEWAEEDEPMTSKTLTLTRTEYDRLTDGMNELRAENERLRVERAADDDRYLTLISEADEIARELRAENERLRAVASAAQQMIDLGVIDRYQPESYALVVALAALKV